MSTEPRYEASPSYAFGQLAKALRAAQEHPDAATRQRAQDKAQKWSAIIKGMADRSLRVGSRTPVDETPAWVTLEVARGGFATGRYLAEGELLEHEQKLLSSVPDQVQGETARERLNLYFSSDAGIDELLLALRDGRYDVDVPEEAALMVAAWLLRAGHGAAALELLSTLQPLMHRLRFYPRLTNEARTSAAGVHVSTAGAVASQLRRVPRSRKLETMNATLAVWNPLYDSLVELWLRTVEGESPRLKTNDDGSLARDSTAQPVATGGWPCRLWPADWTESRQVWLAQYHSALEQHRATGRHHSRKSNFQLLRGMLERSADGAELGERGADTLRHALACAIQRHGAPGERRLTTRRAEDARIAKLPLHSDIAQVVATRLAVLPKQEGIPSLQGATRDINAGEHARVPGGTTVPHRLVRKVERALLAPIDELVERRIIQSAETLAIVLPQLTAQVSAAGIEDVECRDLYARVYSSFRRRRSLLLLNLENQVRIEKLPWVAALQAFREDNLDTATLAQQTLRDVAMLAFEHFPHTIVPNPLLREIGALCKRAGLELPLVEEIAADIFMGTFTQKFSEAAVLSSRLLEGSVYARYYDLPPESGLQADRVPRRLLSRWGKKTSPGFDKLCALRATEAGDGGGSVAKNGAVLEQMQILTSYNLASLVSGLDLREELARRGCDFATSALTWALKQLGRLPSDHLPRLRAIKNAAYAWRQGIFFLSFAEPDTVAQVLGAVATTLAETPADTQRRFRPALAGLQMTCDGGSFDGRGWGPAGERRFLGWSCGPHWYLAASADR